jgi:hypothetical protein
MKPQYLFLLAFILFESNLCFSQTTLTGKILSSATGLKPVDLQFIAFNKKGAPKSRCTYSVLDSLGAFKIPGLIPDSLYVIRANVFGYRDHEFEIRMASAGVDSTFTLHANCKFDKQTALSDWENGNARLLLAGSVAPKANTRLDRKFEKKYQIAYYDFGCQPPSTDCLHAYNQQVFELLDNTYGKAWRKIVRQDVEGGNTP